MPASAYSVGGRVETVSLASVGWVDSSDVLLTPNSKALSAPILLVFVNLIAPNAWRIFIGAEVLWGQLSGGHRSLTLEEFFYCYKP